MTRSERAFRVLPEIVLTGFVFAGVANLIDRFTVDGKLPQPFIFDISDTFMDWFNTAYFAHNGGAFDVWRTIYPPLSFVFLRVFGDRSCYRYDPVAARSCDSFGITVLLTCFVIGGLVAAYAFWRNDRATAVPRGLAFAFGLPWLFTLERGNLILVCFIFFAMAHGNIVQRPWLRHLSAAVTINFKPYLVLPVVALLFRRQWRALELAAIATVLVYLLTYAIFGAGSIVQMASNLIAWTTFSVGLVWEGVYYSTSYAPFLEFNTHRFPTRDFLPSDLVDAMMAAIPVAINGSRLLALVLLAGAWLQPKAVPAARLSCLILTAYLIGSSPGGYSEVFIVFLVFLERWERPGPVVALIMAYLLSIPYDLVLSNIITLKGNSWLSGRIVETPFGISVGMFLRPGFVVIIFWALALDSLALIVRAHRVARPSLALRPLQLTAA